MHQEIRDFIQAVKNRHPEYFTGKTVLEAGSLDINGSPREYFSDPSGYIGLDIGPGKGVDLVTPIHLFKGITGQDSSEIRDHFDVVVSTEMLEHDQHWDKSLVSMVKLLKPGGLLIITCAGPKRAEHGTTATDTYSSPHTTDYYRNLTVDDFMEYVSRKGFATYHLKYGRDGEDIMFYGIKNLIGKQVPVESVMLPANYPPVGPIPVTVCIPTKQRYDVLHLCLLSLALQTRPPMEVVIVDDTDTPMDIRTDPNYMYILRLMTEKGIDWKVQFGKKRGQHHSHQTVQDMAKYDLIFRIDDDEIAEHDVVGKLFDMMQDPNVGAAAPCVMLPGPQPLPTGLENKISYEMSTPNIQWFRWSGIKEAEHLYSCFMYRRDVNKFNLDLSPVCHREETLFTYGIFRKGLKLLVNGDLHVWHFRGEGGGIRTQRDPSLWEHDETIFRKQLKEWGVEKDNRKVIVLDSGLGDHFALKSILPEILEKNKDITIAACFPDAFWDYPDIKLISIAEAKLLYSNIDQFQVYKWMWDHNWKGTLSQAFREMYLDG